MDIYSQIATKIIESQEAIIGPVAIEQAKQVDHLQVLWDKHEVSIEGGNGPAVIDQLVNKYKELFGKISVEVCREAASRYLTGLPSEGQPKSLT